MAPRPELPPVHAPVIDWQDETLACTCGWTWNYATLRPIEDEWRDHLGSPSVLAQVGEERARQEAIGRAKRERGIDWRSCADPAMAGGDGTRYLVLGEEVGEVANAVLEATYAIPSPTSTAYQVLEADEVAAKRHAAEAHLREELIQVAAVAVAWCEAIDARSDRQLSQRDATVAP